MTAKDRAAADTALTLSPTHVRAVRAWLADRFDAVVRGDIDRADGYNAALAELDTLAGACALRPLPRVAERPIRSASEYVQRGLTPWTREEYEHIAHTHATDGTEETR